MEGKTKKKLSESILDKFSIDFLRNQVLKNAYGNDDTVIARLDPRILLVWYLFMAIVPWFVDDLWFLLACFILVAATTVMARVAGLVLFIFALGVFSQTGYLFIVSLFFGGNASTIFPLLMLTLKVATCSWRRSPCFPAWIRTGSPTGFSGTAVRSGCPFPSPTPTGSCLC